MRITQVEPVVIQVNHRGNWLFVQVHTDEGIVGLGEASHNLDEAQAMTAVQVFGERLMGEDPMRIEAIWNRLGNKHAGRPRNTVLSGIEQALWDIMGQALGVPIRTLLGGQLRDSIRLYANVNRHITDRTPAGFARAAAQAVAEGFTAVKCAPFDELRASDHVRTGPKAAWLPGVQRIAAIREAIGPEVELLLDCHGRMEASEAIRVAKELEPYDLFWYEEPVQHYLADELERITAKINIPTASGESVFSVEGFTPFLTRPLVDVIMPDVKHDGGILETKKIASAARMRKMLVAPHNPAGPVSTAASAQVVSTLSNFLILEFAWGEVPWRSQLIEPAERIEGGYLALPDGPGLGHRLNPEMVAAHRA